MLQYLDDTLAVPLIPDAHLRLVRTAHRIAILYNYISHYYCNDTYGDEYLLGIREDYRHLRDGYSCSNQYYRLCELLSLSPNNYSIVNVVSAVMDETLPRKLRIQLRRGRWRRYKHITLRRLLSKLFERKGSDYIALDFTVRVEVMFGQVVLVFEQ